MDLNRKSVEQELLHIVMPGDYLLSNLSAVTLTEERKQARRRTSVVTPLIGMEVNPWGHTFHEDSCSSDLHPRGLPFEHTDNNLGYPKRSGLKETDRS